MKFKVSFNKGSLKNLTEAQKNIQYTQDNVAEIGVYGGRGSNGVSMPKLALWHEEGLGVPRRSMFEDSVIHYKQDLQSFLSALIAKYINQSGGGKVILQKIAMRASGYVQEAFNTGGFGQWKPLSQKTIAQKGNATILVNTGELRRASNEWRVVPKK